MLKFKIESTKDPSIEGIKRLARQVHMEKISFFTPALCSAESMPHFREKKPASNPMRALVVAITCPGRTSC